MLARLRPEEDERPGFIVISNDNRDESEPFIVKKPHSHDFSRTIYSIIKNERVHDFVLGAVVGGGLKMAFNVAAHATGMSWLMVAGAGIAGLGKAAIKQSRANGLDLRKWDWKDLAKTTALATVGGAFAVFAVPFLGDVVQNLTQNFNLGNMFAGLGGLLGISRPEIPALPSVSAPPVTAAPQAILEAPADVTPDVPVDAAPPVEVPAISEQWRHIEAQAEHGNAQAQKDMAMSLLSGVNGFEADADRAMELYGQALEAGNAQAATDLKKIAELNYRGMGDAARAILEQAAPEPEAIVSPITEIAAVTPTLAPLAGTDLSLTFEIQADGSLGGFIPNAAGIVAPGTVFEVPVSQININ